ncbi:hypothetical protein B0I37DRAFT_430410 [Chaetomium sp. MPI-CAGE-AT-0009]|nr:hypothetical protein B0I37DRAFT_430410 [Chaetomium sp. MPI-CAGE-AT-0009]
MSWMKSALRLASAFQRPNRLGQSAVQHLGNRPPSLFEIRSSPNKGLGVFTTKEIPRDAVIMRDPLVFRCELVEDPMQRYRRFTMLPGSTQRDILRLAVRQDVEEHLAVADKLRVASSEKVVDLDTKIRHLEDIIHLNSCGIYYNDLSVVGLFLNVARINHSCIPNADPAFHAAEGYKVMLANRDIEAGEEITTSYISHVWPREVRQRLLSRNGWDFACQCPACDTSHPFSHSHEQRLQALQRLFNDSYMNETVDRLVHAKTWSYAVLEQAGDRARRRIELVAGHHSLRQFSVQVCLGALDIALARYRMRQLRSDLEDALKSLELAIETERIYYGETHVVTRQHEALYDRLQRGDISGA